MFQRLQVLCPRGLSLALSCSFPSYNPPLSPVLLDTSLVCHWEFSLQKPQQNCTATKENFPFSLSSGSWYNSGQGRSYRKSFPTLLKAFLFCMRTGRPVQQASQIGHAISVLRSFQDLNDQALSDLFWSQVWSCFKQQTQLETYNLNYSVILQPTKLLNLKKWLLLRIRICPKQGSFHMEKQEAPHSLVQTTSLPKKLL